MTLVQIKDTDSLKAYLCKLSVQINATPKMDEFANKCIFISGLQKRVVDTLFGFPNLPKDVHGSLTLQRILKPMVMMGSKTTLRNKSILAKICPKAKNARNLGHQTN